MVIVIVEVLDCLQPLQDCHSIDSKIASLFDGAMCSSFFGFATATVLSVVGWLIRLVPVCVYELVSANHCFPVNIGS